MNIERTCSMSDIISRYDIEVPKDKLYDTRHGGPWDRGWADAYYCRVWQPHYYLGDTQFSAKVELQDMTAEEIVAYTAGFNEAERDGFVKEWD